MPELPEIVKNLESTDGVDPKVLSVYRRLKRFKMASCRTLWKTNRDKNWDAVSENKILSDKDVAAMDALGQEPLQINKVAKGVQGSASIVTAQNPTVNFNPIGKGDRYVAELLKRAFDVVWAKSSGIMVAFDVVEESKISGLGVFDVDYDQAKGPFGRIVISESEPTHIYFDPESRERDFSDTDIIKARLRSKKYLMEKYGDDIKESDLSYDPMGEGGDEQTSSGITDGDNYADGEQDGSPDMTPVKNTWEIEAWLLKRVKEYWAVVQEDDGDPKPQRIGTRKPTDEETAAIPGFVKLWPRQVEKRVQRVIVGRKLLEENENPYGVDADGDPVVRIIGLKHDRTRTAYPSCPTTKALPLNREKCKRRGQMIFAAAKSIHGTPVMDENARWMGPDNQPGTPGHPLSWIKISKNTAIAPFMLQSANMDVERYAILEDKSDREIDDAYDMHDVMRGQLPKGQGQTAGRTVLALQDMGSLMSKPFLRSEEAALVRVAKVVIALVLMHWPRYMWQRLLDEDEKMKAPEGETKPQDIEEGSTEEQDYKQFIAQQWEDALNRIKPEDGEESGISMIDIDVNMTAGSSSPTNRIARSEVALENVKAGIYDRKAFLDYTDDPMVDEIENRMAKKDAAAQQAEQMKGMK